jgi:branched-chain amino acid transport system substrate-binding protein
MRLVRTLACCAALSVTMAACSDPGDGGSKNYKFAVIGPFSGQNAAFGDDLKMGVSLAADQINAAGGIKGHKVSLTYLDTQCTATQAANVASKIASDSSIFAVIGDVCSSATLAAIPILARPGITIMSPDSTSPKITDVVKQKNYANFARNIPTDEQMAKQMVTLATGKLHFTKLGVLYASDDFGQPVLSYQKAAVAGAGASMVDTETYTPGTTKDFTPQLSKFKSAGIDALLVDGYYNDAGPAVAQMARVGLKGVPVIASAGVDQPDYAKLAGSAADGSYVFSYYNMDNPAKANTSFRTAFAAKHAGASASEYAYAVWGYEIPFIYKSAIEAGGTKKSLAKVVKTISYDGPTGTSRFDGNGDVIGKSLVVLVVRNGGLAFDADLTNALNG